MKSAITFLAIAAMAIPTLAGEVTPAPVAVDPCCQPAPQVQLQTVQPPAQLQTRTRTVMVPQTIQKHVPVNETVMVPTAKTELQTRTRTVMVPKQVTEQVPVTKTVMVPQTRTRMTMQTQTVHVPQQIQEQVCVQPPPQTVAVPVQPVAVAPVVAAPVQPDVEIGIEQKTVNRRGLLGLLLRRP